MYGGFVDIADGSSTALTGKGSKNPNPVGSFLGTAWETKMTIESVLS